MTGHNTTVGAGRRAWRQKKWSIFFFLALAQLMIVLDTTVMNIAMPSAQNELGMSNGDRQWIITAYALTFGGLLLLGGRVTDLVGNKRAFLIGLVGFSLASALGGAALNGAMLVAGRALQGVFGALLVPAGLALVSTLFPEGGERARAFGIYSAIAGSGGAVGLLVGGLLTEYATWRWTLYVAIPIAALSFVGIALLFKEADRGRRARRLDVVGALLVTLGLVALVYGFTLVEEHGWMSAAPLGLLTAGGVLLVAFAVVEGRVSAPLLPGRLVMERNRAGALITLGLAVVSMFGMFLFLTYFLQVVRGFSPLITGLSFLPMVAGLVVGSTQIAGRLMTVLTPRVLMCGGLLSAAVSMFLMTLLRADSGYLALVVPAELLLGLGMGVVFVPAMSLATRDVLEQDRGIASAAVNAVQQIGGAVGTALLNTVAAGVTAAFLVSGAGSEAEAMVHGFALASWVAVVVLLAATVVCALLVNAPEESDSEASEERAGSGP